jgi:Na+/H+-dicarboxylate symporter
MHVVRHALWIVVGIMLGWAVGMAIGTMPDASELTPWGVVTNAAR